MKGNGYFFSFWQEFASYSKESDPERVRQIAQQGVKDIEWLVQKVKIGKQLHYF